MKRGNFLIENSDKPGWFLFDIDENEKIKLLWSNIPSACIRWHSDKSAQRFIADKKLVGKKFKVYELKDDK